MKLTKKEYDRAIRAVYRGIDAVQVLADLGFGDGNTERAFDALRAIERKVEDAEPRKS